MSDLRLDPVTDDLVFSPTGDLQIVDGLEFVAQRLRIRLDTQKGEWFLDLTAGVPYREIVLVRNPDLGAIGAMFRERILSTPEVTSLRSFALTFDNSSGLLSLTFEALTPFGVLEAVSEAPDFTSLIVLLLLGPLGSIL